MIDYIESAMKAPQGPVIEGKLPANGSTIEEVIYISNCQLVEMGWMGGGYRRRINTEAKAKVVAAVLGDTIYSVPCRASYFALGHF